ncbi:MAG: selenide, water dikinase SelD, partial [bacterium]|nr:selenide, water dikinase SelD [bacterium]
LPGAVENASMGMIPEGMYKNRDFIGSLCTIESSVKTELADIAFDPQTSGGLLIALSDEQASALVSELKSNGIKDAGIIAEVKKSGSKVMRIV